MKSAIERRMEIVAIVNKNSSARVEDLAEAFSVSTVTIRQDLNFLEKNGYIIRSRWRGYSQQRNDRRTQ